MFNSVICSEKAIDHIPRTIQLICSEESTSISLLFNQKITKHEQNHSKIHIKKTQSPPPSLLRLRCIAISTAGSHQIGMVRKNDNKQKKK